MRRAPGYILKKLRQYHKALGLVWDGRNLSWMITWNNAPHFRYDHLDGTIARNDFGDIMDVIQKNDLKLHGVTNPRAAFARLDARNARNEEENRREMEACRIESEQRARCIINGPKTFVTA